MRKRVVGTSPKTLEEFVDSLRDDYNSYGVIAEGVGMTESGFLRGVKNNTLSVEFLFGLAAFTGTNPGVILRLAGKFELATLVERLYGPGKDGLTKLQQHVLALWGAIQQDRKLSDALLYQMETYAETLTRRDATASGRPSPFDAGASGSAAGMQGKVRRRPRIPPL